MSVIEQNTENRKILHCGKTPHRLHHYKKLGKATTTKETKTKHKKTTQRNNTTIFLIITTQLIITTKQLINIESK